MQKNGLHVFHLWTILIVIVYFLPAQPAFAKNRSHSLHKVGAKESRQESSKPTGSAHRAVPRKDVNTSEATKSKAAQQRQSRSSLEKSPKKVNHHQLHGRMSCYAKRFQGRMTATRARFDHGKLTIAHPSLPKNIWAEITNLENGRSITALVNDSGPYDPNLARRGILRPSKKYIADGSRRVIRELGGTFDKKGKFIEGSIKVKIRPLS